MARKAILQWGYDKPIIAYLKENTELGDLLKYSINRTATGINTVSLEIYVDLEKLDQIKESQDGQE